jgi:putative acetyltransferase
MTEAISYVVRRAELADVEDIAAAHLDSIRSLGGSYYDAAIVGDWGAQIRGELYARAMANGEVFFIAVAQNGTRPEVLGFSSHHVDQGEHRTAVYVRGNAARRGIGSALFRLAEAAAIDGGATSIYVAASLAAVGFYKVNGFEEVEPGQHRLSSGRLMPCVFMRKTLGLEGGASSQAD